ncbi:MAG TPA: DNA-3-methyladenine glycosylase [Flavilitoribacter sp.]|nr:DNA-3-methyladenine glycosylase [Flavilitoribacter sp.]
MPPPTRLPDKFYQNNNVVAVARDLLGKYLVTCFDGQLASGRIVETEAYRAPEDKACHAYGNRRTKRTEVMFSAGGVAYIYLCYGIHHLFNVVTGPEGSAHAVLIRAVEPADNIPLMLERRKMQNLKPQLTAGPGVMSMALGIRTDWTGHDMTAPDSRIWIEDRNGSPNEHEIASGPRIGVGYAGECADWPWRFWIPGSPWVSKG